MLFLFLAIGTFGYVWIEGYDWLDAFYMTVITLSTVGYGEVIQLSAEGKVFTIFLILSGVGILAYAASVFAEELISGKLVERYKKRNLEKKINELQSHTIICGYGRNGRQAALKLAAHQKDFIIIEKSEEKLKDAQSEIKNLNIIYGDATLDETLLQSKINQASALIAALPSDADNLYIVLSARQLNPQMQIISRATEASSEKKLKIAGADNVIMPDKIGGEHMAAILATPNLTNLIERISFDSDSDVNLVEINTNKFKNQFIGISIKDLKIKELTGCTLLGVKEHGESLSLNPNEAKLINSNASLILMGTPLQIEKLKSNYFF